LLSPFPLVAEFGLLLGSGVLICLAVAFPLGFAALSLRGPGPDRPPLAVRFGPVESARGWAKSALALAILAPGRLLVVAVLIAACGWAVSTQGSPASEISQLLPGRNAAVQDLNTLEEATGSSGEIDLIVRSPDVTDPATVTWLDQVRTLILARSGYGVRRESCEGADLCPGPSIPDFVPDGGRGLKVAEIREALRAVPPNELEAIVAGGLATGRDPTETKVPFAVRSGSVDGQSEAIETIRRAVEDSNGGNGPPPGVSAELAGLPVVVTESVNELGASRYLLIAVALLAIAIVLSAVYRSGRRVVVPLVPIVVAGGWSALVIASLDIPLNPLSAILSVMVIAIATEFSVILSARFYQDRVGSTVAAALRRSYGRTGMAIAASGVTAIAGFAALVASDVGILREFGLIAVFDLSVALLGVAVVLPAILTWIERRR
jgi:predicted RND superfamily exporter protein